MYSDLELAPFSTLEELSLVLYDVSVAANNSQLSGESNTAADVTVQVDQTNYTGGVLHEDIFSTLFLDKVETSSVENDYTSTWQQ